jgi:hypothetical protein
LLQRSLFRSQQRCLASLLDRPNAAFARYRDRYQERLRAENARPLSEREMQAQLCSADVVYVGDYHSYAPAQHNYMHWVKVAAAQGRPVLLALELFDAGHQPQVDAYLRGSLDELSLKHSTDLGHDTFCFSDACWTLLRYARENGLGVLAIDHRKGRPSLQERDAFAGKLIARAAAQRNRPLVMALVGQFHVIPEHLPRCVQESLASPKRHLVLYQYCESLYWRWGHSSATPTALELRSGELCFWDDSPAAVQQSYVQFVLKHLEPTEACRRRFKLFAEPVAELYGIAADKVGAPPRNIHFPEMPIGESARWATLLLRRTRADWKQSFALTPRSQLHQWALDETFGALAAQLLEQSYIQRQDVPQRIQQALPASPDALANALNRALTNKTLSPQSLKAAFRNKERAAQSTYENLCAQISPKPFPQEAA